MLANGIKNAILFLLVILILHFLIKNLSPSPIAKNVEKFIATITNMASGSGSGSSSGSGSGSGSVINKGNDNDDLLTKCEPNLPKKIDNNHLPLSTTCDANITELLPEKKKEVKEDCHIYQNHKKFMIIKKYENENPNNDNSLGAFDSFEDYYHQYNNSCSNTEADSGL